MKTIPLTGSFSRNRDRSWLTTEHKAQSRSAAIECVEWYDPRMTLSIDISPDVEARLRDTATRLGVEASEYAKLLIEQGLPTGPAANPNQPTIDLLTKWEMEYATNDPKEIARRTQELEDLKRSMNQNRVSAGGPNARMVFP